MMDKQKNITPESIGETVDQIILGILPKEKQKMYTRAISLVDLKFESMQINLLVDALNKEFSINLHPIFLLQNPNAESIIQYLIKSRLHEFKDWLYEFVWKNSPKPEINSLPFQGNWLIIGIESDPLLPLIKKLLMEELQNCFVVNPLSQDDLQNSFSQFKDLSYFEGVIFLCPPTNFTSEPTVNSIESYHKPLFSCLINVVKGFDSLNFSKSPKLWVVSQSCINDGSFDSIVQWPLAAVCKVIQGENPLMHCCSIGFDTKTDIANIAETLFLEVCSKSNEPQIAWKDGKRQVYRMVRSGIKEIRIPNFPADATYMVAGGFRPVGLLLATWYIAHGAKNLILVDSHDKSAHMEALLKEWRASGIKIEIFQVNLSDISALKEIFEEIKKTFPPIKGIIHAAGAIDNELLINMNWERFKPSFDLKIACSWNLHELSKDLDLEHFIMLSSPIGELAPLGKASHTSGNSFLDALSFYRKNHGMPSLTIKWGPWDTQHVIVKKLIDTTLPNRMELLHMEDAFKLLETLFYQDKTQIASILIKWPAVFAHLEKENLLLDEITTELGYKKNPILKIFHTVTHHQRYPLIETFVQGHLLRLMMLPPDEKIDLNQNFESMGLDKLMMADLKNRIQLDVESAVLLSANLVQDNATVTKLSKALMEALNESLKLKVRKTNVYF